jgi:hypothetical protein
MPRTTSLLIAAGLLLLEHVAASVPAPVLLGTAGDFVILAKAGISVVPHVPSSATITGDIGVSPAAATYITGFSLTSSGSTESMLSTEVAGDVYAADYAVPTPAKMTTAISNMEAAYTSASSRNVTDASFGELLEGKLLVKLTLAPGVYKWTTDMDISADITLNGGSDDRWIFITSGSVIFAPNTNVILSGNAKAENIVWAVAGGVEVGAGAHLKGIVITTETAIFGNGASLSGRLLSLTAVTLDQNTITQP